MTKYGQIDVSGKSIYFFSKALFTNFYSVSGYNIMLDCGDGAALFLKEMVLKINAVFISHHHADHFSGLMGFIQLRNTVKGGTSVPLDVYYPAGNRFIRQWVQYYSGLGIPLNYNIRFSALKEYAEVFLSRKVFIKAYPVVHEDHCFSYCLFEKTKKLKKEYIGENIQKLKGESDEKSLMREVLRCRLYYSGDFYRINPNTPDNIDIAILDSTFLYKSDRSFNSHLSLEELFCYLSRKKIKVLLLTHFSQRYSIGEIRDFLSGKAGEQSCRMYILYNDKAERIPG